MTSTKKAFKDFFNSEKSSGIVLIGCTVLSLVLANLIVGKSYTEFWNLHIGADFWHIELNHSIEKWINDGLMTIFFLLVGLELKREVLIGKLSNPKEAMLPIFGAIGGMIIPALIFLLFNLGE